MLLVGTIHLEDRFCASRKGGIGEVGKCDPPGESTWCWDIERPWLAEYKPFLSSFAQTSLQNAPLNL